MEESTKKIFKPKFELVQECNGLCFNTFAVAAAILQGTEIIEPPRRSSNVGGVSYTLRDIALTH
jgi:hypothetical protein